MSVKNDRIDKIKIFVDGETLGLFKALQILTDDFIDGGGDFRQTVVDMREAITELLKLAYIFEEPEE